MSEPVTGTSPGAMWCCFVRASMVNAAMNAQLVLERFDITGIVISASPAASTRPRIGDRGGPALGPVSEVVFAREVDGKFQPPSIKTPYPNYGMIFPTDVGVRSAKGGKETRFWSDADQACRLRRARRPVELSAVRRAGLPDRRRVWSGGNGVSGAAFVDNAAFRRYAFETFKAQVLDMESAAVRWSPTPMACRSLPQPSDPPAAAKAPTSCARSSTGGQSAAVVTRFLTLWMPPR